MLESIYKLTLSYNYNNNLRLKKILIFESYSFI